MKKIERSKRVAVVLSNLKTLFWCICIATGSLFGKDENL